MINLKSGGAVIAPWQIDELDEDWLAAFMETAPQQVERHNQQVRSHRDAFIKKHVQRYRH